MEILVWKNDQFWTTNDHNRRSDLTYDYALNMIFDWIRFFLISMEILVWKNDQFWTTNDHNRRSDLSPIGPTYEHIRRIIVQSFLLGALCLPMEIWFLLYVWFKWNLRRMKVLIQSNCGLISKVQMKIFVFNGFTDF